MRFGLEMFFGEIEVVKHLVSLVGPSREPCQETFLWRGSLVHHHISSGVVRHRKRDIPGAVSIESSE
jgi:hypothetical protein